MTSLLIAIVAGAAIAWIFRTHSRRKKYVVKHAADLKALEEFTAPMGRECDWEEKITLPDLSSTELTDINRIYRIADMHFCRGAYDEAEKHFVKILAINEFHPEALNRLGVIYVQQGNPRRAEMLYRKLFSITQKEAVYYANYGRCLYEQGRLQDALEAYENAIKLDGTRATRFVSVGQIYYEQKNYVKALAYFVRALELDPQNSSYLKLTAELGGMVGDSERQQRSLRKIIEIEPYNEEAKKKLKEIAG